MKRNSNKEIFYKIEPVKSKRNFSNYIVLFLLIFTFIYHNIKNSEIKNLNATIFTLNNKIDTLNIFSNLNSENLEELKKKISNILIKEETIKSIKYKCFKGNFNKDGNWDNNSQITTIIITSTKTLANQDLVLQSKNLNCRDLASLVAK